MLSSTDMYEFFVPLLPRPDYSVRLNELNYPLTRLNVYRQSTVFQCVKAINNLRESIDLPVSAYKQKVEYNKHILGTYEIQH